MLKFLLFQSCVTLKINDSYNVVFKYKSVYNSFCRNSLQIQSVRMLKKMRHIEDYIEELIRAGF